MRAVSCAAVILGLCPMAGCDAPADSASADAAGDLRVSFDTVGDTVVIHTISGSTEGRRRLSEVIRIGAVEGAEHETFGQVGALALAPNGDILIYDAQVPAIRRYTSEGQYVSTIGRSGSGPGEYRGVAGMTVTAEGLLVVNDFGNRRINIYDSRGDILKTWVLGQAIAERRPLYVDSMGQILLLDLTGQGSGAQVLLRLDSTGSVTRWSAVPQATVESPSIEIRSEQGSIGTIVPFTPELHWTVTAAGDIAFTPGDQYEINILKSDTVWLRLTRAVEPVAITAEERAAEEARITNFFQRFVDGWRWRDPSMPASKPPIRWLGAGSDGSLWAAVAQPGTAIPEAERTPRARSYVREPIMFDVYDAAGRFTGQVEAPPGLVLITLPHTESGCSVGRGP